MHPRSFVKLSIAALIMFLFAVCVWVMTPEYSAGSFSGKPLLPDLMNKINEVEVFAIEHGGETMTFMRDDAAGWVMTEADNYPADKDRIRNALIGLAGLEKIEPKTALPDFYPDLRVEDSSVKGARSYLVTLLDSNGAQIADVLMGKRSGDDFGNLYGYFARFPDDAQSWLVRGNVDVTGGVSDWLNTRLLPLAKRKIASYTIIDSTKTREAVYRRSTRNGDLDIAYLSDGYVVTGSDFIRNAEQILHSFDFEKPVARTAEWNGIRPAAYAVVETFDRLTAYLFIYLKEGAPYVAVTFEAQPNASDAVKAEAKKLDAFHAPWLYRMPNEKVADLLPFLKKPDEKPTAAPSKRKKAKKRK